MDSIQDQVVVFENVEGERVYLPVDQYFTARFIEYCGDDFNPEVEARKDGAEVMYRETATALGIPYAKALED